MDLVGNSICGSGQEEQGPVRLGKWIAAIGLGVLMIFLGGYREILFVNINEQILFNTGHIQDYRVLDSFRWLQDYRTGHLETLKWILTIAFSLAFLVLGLVVLRKVLKDTEGGRWLMITYLGAVIISGFFFLLGQLIGQQELGYTLSRVFMGALQSPFILMLMIPARMLAIRM